MGHPTPNIPHNYVSILRYIHIQYGTISITSVRYGRYRGAVQWVWTCVPVAAKFAPPARGEHGKISVVLHIKIGANSCSLICAST